MRSMGIIDISHCSQWVLGLEINYGFCWTTYCLSEQTPPIMRIIKDCNITYSQDIRANISFWCHFIGSRHCYYRYSSYRCAYISTVIRNKIITSKVLYVSLNWEHLQLFGCWVRFINLNFFYSNPRFQFCILWVISRFVLWLIDFECDDILFTISILFHTGKSVTFCVKKLYIIKYGRKDIPNSDYLP